MLKDQEVGKLSRGAICRVACVLGLILGVITYASPSSSEEGEAVWIDPLAVQERLELPGRLVALRLNAGLVVARAGSVLTVRQTDVPTANPDEVLVRQEVAIRPPAEAMDDPAVWSPEVLDAFRELVSNGASLSEALATVLEQIGSSPTLSMTASDPNEYVNADCVEFGNSYAKYGGCFGTKRGYTSEGSLYRGDEYWSWGRVDSDPSAFTAVRVVEVLTGFQYEGSIVFKQDPMSSELYGSCATATFDASAGSLSVSISQPICPETLNVYSAVKSHKVVWEGWSQSQRASAGVNITRTPTGELRGQQFLVAATFIEQRWYGVKNCEWVKNAVDCTTSLAIG